VPRELAGGGVPGGGVAGGVLDFSLSPLDRYAGSFVGVEFARVAAGG
jgi:hypothetical protein